MGWFKGQFIDIIQWEPKNNDNLVWRFERHNAEIKNGASLQIKPKEAAVFIYEGAVVHTFVKAGKYPLTTENYPFITTFMGLPYGLESPHKAYVYFINLQLFQGQKWGTKGKVDFNDPEFGPVAIGAYGTYDFSVKNSKTFFESVVAAMPEFTVEGIANQIRMIISSLVSTVIAKSKTPLMEIEQNKDDYQEMLIGKIQEELDLYGLEIKKFIIVDISFPPEIEEALAELRKANV